MEITNEQKQVMLSGILGDGSIIKGAGGAMQYSCVHREYMELKYKLLGDLSSSVKQRFNNGYKKGTIYTIRSNANDYGKLITNYSFEDIMEDIDELGIALWMFDDGSRHKTGNFYNINTHAIDRRIEEDVLIPYLNKLNIFPSVLTETKKDGREFSYLYVSKWRGAMELSSMMRKLKLDCYDYKLMPIELEEAYHKVKDSEDFKNKSSLGKTNAIKALLDIPFNNFYYKDVTSVEMKSSAI